MKQILRFSIGLVAVAAGLCLAVGLSSRKQEKLAHFYERVVFQVIADRVTQGAPDAQARVLRLLDYVHAQVLGPTNDRPISDIEPLEILAAGRGWCDQGANVFSQLVRTLPLDARLVFLRDERGSSPHSIAEVYLDGEWRVVDTLGGIPFFNRGGKLATPEELAQDPALLTENPEVKLMGELNATRSFTRTVSLYKQSPTIFNTWQGKRKIWLERCPEPFRQQILCLIQDLYFRLPIATRGLSAQQRLLKRARHYTFLGRTRLAERAYAQLIEQPEDKMIRQEARYFLGCTYQQLGRFNEALEQFNAFLKEEPNAGLSPYIYLAMGEVYESLKRREEALEAYRRSELITRDVVIARQMAELQK